MVAFKNKTGEKHFNNEGCEFEIIEYFGWDNCTIQFKDGNITKNICYGNINKGNVKNFYHPSVCGVGYIGVGKYTTRTNNRIYTAWVNLIKRCYSEKVQEKHISYKEAKVCNKWHNFQNFAQWFEENYIEDFQLDKDILFKGNKVYSPETCVFVPQEVNLTFIKRSNRRGSYPVGVRITEEKRFQAAVSKNSKRAVIGTFATIEEAFQAYKVAKEAHIKEVADKWKDKIDPRVYQAMYKYQVEITD